MNTIGFNGQSILAQQLGSGRKTVTEAGTAEALGASALINGVVISALSGNAGAVVVGGSDVVAAAETRAGIPLGAGDSIALQVSNLAAVYVDVEEAGDGVSFIYFQ